MNQPSGKPWPVNGPITSAHKVETSSGEIYPPLPGSDYEMKPRKMSAELASLLKCDPNKRHKVTVIGTARAFLGYPYVEGRWVESGKIAHWPLDDFHRMFEPVNNVVAIRAHP